MAIYFDYHAHSPIDPRVLQTMIDAFSSGDANPHSTHQHGSAAHGLVEDARARVAGLIGARPSEIIFTSGATEANNLVFSGMAHFMLARGKNRLAVFALEHPSILQAANELRSKGFSLDVIPAGTDGLINLEELNSRVTSETGLVSVASANHEIGVIQPVEAISAIVRSKGALFHSDLAQIAGKAEVSSIHYDLASLSSHKLAGPGGIGALFIRRLLKPKLTAQIVGGGQEAGTRSGTLSVPLCAAFGAACEIAQQDLLVEGQRVQGLRDNLAEAILSIPGAKMNGAISPRLPGNINIRFEDVDGEALAFHLQDRLSISTGSACSAKSLEPSHVLMAIGLTRQQAESTVRIGIGRFTTAEEISEAAGAIQAAVTDLRATRSRA